jgi:membrane-associated phospholipid phosphatase
VFVSITVGLCTVYLDTHWVSDVLGGWLAGVLVLLVLPWIMPYAERVAEMVIRWGRRRFTSRAKHRQPKHRAVPVAATRMPPPVHEQVYQGPEPVKAGGVRG